MRCHRGGVPKIGILEESTIFLLNTGFCTLPPGSPLDTLNHDVLQIVTPPHGKGRLWLFLLPCSNTSSSILA